MALLLSGMFARMGRVARRSFTTALSQNRT